jgi:hypothetical protein
VPISGSMARQSRLLTSPTSTTVSGVSYDTVNCCHTQVIRFRTDAGVVIGMPIWIRNGCKNRRICCSAKTRKNYQANFLVATKRPGLPHWEMYLVQPTLSQPPCAITDGIRAASCVISLVRQPPHRFFQYQAIASRQRADGRTRHRFTSATSEVYRVI